MFVLPALGASLAYSTDVVFGKLALDDMPMVIFTFVLSICYAVLAIGLFVWQPTKIREYVTNKKNTKTIALAILAVVTGTVIADVLMWYAVKKSPTHHLPIAIALIHTTPVISLIIVALYYKHKINWKVALGVILTVVGCMITILFDSDLAGMLG